MSLVFYTNPMSRGQIVRWMLEEIGQPYQQVLLDYNTTMKDPAYLAINPMGKVPAITHNGTVITEGAAICTYLADAFPEAQLAPQEQERAAYYRWLFFAAGPLDSAMTLNAMQWKPDPIQQRMVGFGSFDRTVATLEQALTNSEYICGDRFTAADIYVGSEVDWGINFDMLPKLSTFVAYAERLRAREAYQRAKAIDAKLAPAQAAED